MGQGQGIEDAAVDEPPVGLTEGAEEHRDGDGGADGVEQAAMVELHFFTARDVGGKGGVGQGEVFDVDVGQQAGEFADEAVAFDQTVAAQAEVGQLPHLAAIPGAEPLFAGFEAAGGVHGADEGTHGAAGKRGDVVAVCEECFDDSDVGDAACSAHGEDEGGRRVCFHI